MEFSKENIIFATTKPKQTKTMKTLLTTFLLMLCTAVGAQTAEKLYDEGKALYDAKKYTQALPTQNAAAEKGHKKSQ